MKADAYTKAVLTAIALALAWIGLGGPELLAVHAQAAPQPQGTKADFHASRIAASNGFVLLREYSSMYNQECFILYETDKAVAMAPAKCP